jgi:DnaJ-class molecular chaperone
VAKQIIYEPCPECDGTGIDSYNDGQCQNCDGTGEVEVKDFYGIDWRRFLSEDE